MLPDNQIHQIILKHLPELHDEQISFVKLSGLTNVTYSVDIKGHPTYIFKHFSDGFDRQTQNRIVKHLSQSEMAAKLIFADKRYRIQEFIHSTYHPSIEELKNQDLIKQIIEHLFKFHSIQIEQGKIIINFSDFLWSQKQIKQLKQHENSAQVEAYQSLMNQVKCVMAQQDIFKKKLMPQDRTSIRFCHNDLNNLNILIGQNSLHFIDYDYVGKNYLAYDIANFLNETCINYTVQQYPGFKIEKYIDYELIKRVAKYYPGHYQGLDLEILKFMCIVNLYWAIWSIKRHQLNKCSLFGILEHGIARMELFQHYNKLVDEYELIGEQRKKQK